MPGSWGLLPFLLLPMLMGECSEEEAALLLGLHGKILNQRWWWGDN